MAFNPDIRHRQSTRLRDYDYSSQGIYFITICVKEKEFLFGDINNGQMIQSELGLIAEKIWREIPSHFEHVLLDKYIVMPNHIHGILIIQDREEVNFVGATHALSPKFEKSGNHPPATHALLITSNHVGAQHAAPLQKATGSQPWNVKPGSLGAIIRSFKSAVTREINIQRNTPGASIWQRNYHDHIIQDLNELTSIRQYIQKNPAKWADDEFNPVNMAAKRTRHAVPMPKKRAITGTKTASFGSPGRINHDSSAFYASRLYESLPKEEKVKYIENPIPADYLDKIICSSSEAMTELPDNSVHLMVTSPPYNVGKDYDQDLTLDEYRAFLKRVWTDVKRVLVPGGRACINIANLGRKPYIPLNAFIVQDMQDLGFLHRGEIIWNKAASGSPSTAWGSWQSAKNPILRDIHEYIMVFSKGNFSRQDRGRKSTISKEDFLKYTKSVWDFGAEPAKKVGHPAPFPVELPRRLIELYTFEGEVILDPFAGSGQAALAALGSNRHYVGYEINEEYVQLAEKRIKAYISNQDQTELVESATNGHIQS
jgi:site-specific DNA-methyltransferase (adenine-specific)